MFRRKTAIYTILFTAGITAGFFMFDKRMPAEAAGFMLAVFSCLYFAPWETDAEKRKERTAGLTAVFLAGLALFAMRSAIYDSRAADLMKDGEDSSAVIRGTVLSAALKEDRLKLVLDLSGAGARGRVLVRLGNYSYHPAGEAYKDEVYMLTGAVIECRGSFREIDPADNPGCFDEKLYMRGKGVYIGFRADSIDVADMENSPFNRFRRYLYRTREQLLDQFSEEDSGFIRGVIFGDKSEIDEDIVREFNQNATGHILAVSGLHVGFLYALLRSLSGKRRTKGISLIIILIIILYGEMTLWSAATVRACLVISISILSSHFKRAFDLLTAVSAAALIILVRQPYQLFDSGFRMSFLAMLAIAFLTKPLSSLLGETLGAMFAVQLGTVPITALTFCRFNPLSVFINIPVVLLASLMVPLCVLLLMLSFITGSVPGAGIWLAELMAYAVRQLNHILALGGEFSFRMSGIGGTAVLMFYLAAFGLSSEWVRINLIRKNKAEILKAAAALLIPVLMLSSCFYDRFADDEIVFVSVGQGDCVHIRADGRNLLLDGGGQEDYNIGEKVLMPYLLHGGCGRVELAAVTHLHMDHYKGILELQEVFPVGAMGVPADYRLSLEEDREERSVKVLYLKAGMQIKADRDVYIEPIWPVGSAERELSIDDPNEHNMVYMIHYKGIRVMVTGDLLEEDEMEMLEYYKDTDALKCDLLKIAHHGSKSSSSDAFLNAAAPSIAVIQVGKNNLYGHPHQQTLDRLNERGIAVYRTDVNGAVGIDIKRDRIKTDIMKR